MCDARERSDEAGAQGFNSAYYIAYEEAAYLLRAGGRVSGVG